MSDFNVGSLNLLTAMQSFTVTVDSEALDDLNDSMSHSEKW